MSLPTRPRKKSKNKPAASRNLQPFLGRWLIACGIVLAIAVLFAVGGLFSETPAIIASGICVVAIVGCLLAGTIWMAIDLGQENVPLGLCVLLIPAAGPALAFLNKGPALRGAVVFVTIIPLCLLLGLMLLVFYPKYSGSGQRAAQTATWKDLMSKLDEQVRPDTPVVTVTMSVASRPGSLDGIQPQCEALLSPYKSYVPGSLKIDAASRRITYQYRGSEKFDSLVAFYLSSATGAFIPQQRVDADGS